MQEQPLNTDEAKSDVAEKMALVEKRRKRKRLLLRLIPVLGLAIPFLWVIRPYVIPPAAIEISRETTYITQPVGRDGYVSYSKWLSDKLSAQNPERILVNMKQMAVGPVYVELTDRFQNKRARAIDEQVTDAIEKMSDAYITAWRKPWTAEEQPELGETLEANADWYAHAEKTLSSVSHIVMPAPAKDPWAMTLVNTMLPGCQQTRTDCRRFLFRAANRFGEGQTAAAINDVAFVYQHAAREDTFLISFLVRVACESLAANNLMYGLLSADSIDVQSIQVVENLPHDSLLPTFTEALDCERYISLDVLCTIHKTGLVSDGERGVIQGDDLFTWLANRRLYGSVDWNAVMKDQNLFFDQLIDSARNKNYADATADYKKLRDFTNWKEIRDSITAPSPIGRSPSTEDYCRFCRTYSSNYLSVFQAATTATLRRRVVQLVSRLAVWKLKTGAYPDTLEPLKSLKDFSVHPAEIFIDPFTDEPLIYAKTPIGFSLRSPGANGVVDNDNLSEELINRTTSNVDRDKMDYLWQWPPVVNSKGD